MGNLPPPNAVDIAILVMVLFSLFRGYVSGLSGELAQLASVVAAFIVGLSFYEPLSVWIIENTRLEGTTAKTVAFVTTVITAAIAMIILRYMIKYVMRVVIEEKVDKPAGLIAGGIKSVVVVLIVVVVMNLWPHEYLNRKFGEESVIGNLVLKILPSLREKIEAADLPDAVMQGGGRRGSRERAP